MNDNEKLTEIPRRTILQAAAGLAIVGLAWDASATEIQDVGIRQFRPTAAKPGKKIG